jgi:hypothetical protein
MSLRRLQRDEVYRFYLASRLAFADWENPTAAEFNANPTNDPSGLIFNVTCALNTEGSQFDLDDPELDESLTFCQSAGNSEVLSRSATIVYEFEESKARWDDASSLLPADGFNVATLTKSLLMWRGIEYFAILSIGKAEDEPMAIGDRVKMAEVATDWAVPVTGTGENIRWSQTFAKRSSLNWNYEIGA